MLDDGSGSDSLAGRVAGIVRTVIATARGRRESKKGVLIAVYCTSIAREMINRGEGSRFLACPAGASLKKIDNREFIVGRDPAEHRAQ